MEAYQAAVADKSDFLEASAEVEAVAAEITAADPTADDIEDAVGEAVNTSLAALDVAYTGTTYSYELTSASPAALTQMISDIQADLAKDQQDARTAIADSGIAGLQTSLNALVSAHGRYLAAVESQEQADQNFTGELAKFDAVNDQVVYTLTATAPEDLVEGEAVVEGAVVEGAGGEELIVLGTNGQLVAGPDASGVDGVHQYYKSCQRAYCHPQGE